VSDALSRFELDKREDLETHERNDEGVFAIETTIFVRNQRIDHAASRTRR